MKMRNSFASTGLVILFAVTTASQLYAQYDWGDAPAPTYPTLNANNGARHLIVSNMFLGALIDAESDGQPNATATGDDTNLLADEDGVTLTTLLQPGGFAGANIVASIPGQLDAWIDFNNDGDWNDEGERIASGQPLSAGTNSLLFAVPVSASQGTSVVARIRYSSAGVASYTGSAPDGEVEDYLIDIENIDSGKEDWGDAPDPTYPTKRGSGLPSIGARHTIVPGVVLGALIDAELDGQPDSLALGDDTPHPPPSFSLLADEDGVSFITKIVAGTNATIDVVAGVSGGLLDAWIDFDADGSWSNEHLFGGTSLTLNPGLNAGISFAVPQPSALGPTYARFRISSAGNLTPEFIAPDGEVEDYMVNLYQPVPVPDILITNLAFNASNTVATVKWNAQTNVTYQLESSTNLTSNLWITAGSTVLGPANSQTNNLSTESENFYRVTAPWTE